MTILYWYLGGVVFFTLLCRFFPNHAPEMFIPTKAIANTKYRRGGLYTVLLWPLSIFFFIVSSILYYVLRPPLQYFVKVFNWIIRKED
jgi:hypothetical protein